MQYRRFERDSYQGIHMKKVIQLLSLFCLAGNLVADIEFESTESRLRVNVSGHGASIDYDPAVVVPFSTGTIQYQRGADNSGKAFQFSYGRIEESLLTYADVANVSYSPGADGALITMSGGGLVDAVNGFRIETLTVGSGEGENILAGAPKLLNAINLGCGVDLTCKLTAPLSKNIRLRDGGTLTLESDLFCQSNVAITGCGNVDTNGHSLSFGQHYASCVHSDLTFIGDVNVINLRGSLVLDGEWTFENVTVLTGSSSVLDLSHGGVIYIAPGATLKLSDVVIRGITQDNFIFLTEEGESAGTVVLNGARLELADRSEETDSELVFDAGTIEVYADSMITIKNRNLVFEEDAVLNVHAGVTLSLNVLSNTFDPFGGTVYAPYPIYVDHEKNDENVALNVNELTGNLIIGSGGAIVEMSQALIPGGYFGGIPPLLDNSTMLTPGDVIHLEESAEFDGGGSTIVFSKTGGSQFVVDADVTVSLSNIEFQGITNNTFDLGENAKIELGANVRWVLTEDVTWTREQIVLAGVGNVFELISDGPVRTLYFVSDNVGSEHNPNYREHLVLNSNAIILRNVELKGLRHVSYDSICVDEDTTVVGSITLGGNAAIELVEYVNDDIFTIVGLDNRIRLAVHEPVFEGQLHFDPDMMSSLEFSFITPPDAYRPPVLHFYDDFMNLSSENGVAYLSLKAPSLTINNHAVSAFNMGKNSVLSGESVTVVGNPIMQTSARASFIPGLQLLSSLDEGAVSFSTTLLNSMRGPGYKAPVPAYIYAARKKNEELALTRGLSLPPSNLAVVHYDTAIALPVMAGNLVLKDSYGHRYTNFRISETRDLNVTFSDGVEVVQGPVDTVLKYDDVINVVRGTVQKPNTLKLSHNMALDGLLMLDDNAVMCFEFAPDTDPISLTIGSDLLVSCGECSTIIFRGNGTVIMPESFTLSFGETHSTLCIGAGTTLLMSEGQALTLVGKGTVLCQDGGKIVISNASDVCCGVSSSDDITLRAKNGGTVCVGDVVDTDNGLSYLSFPLMRGELDFSDGGRLVIANDGRVECNGRYGAYLGGVIRSLNFSDGGLLYIASQGLLNVGSNSTGDGINLYVHGATISGNGCIGKIGTEYIGKIQQNLDSKERLTADQLVRALIQTQSNLLYATLFVDSDNNRILRSRNGTLVEIGVNEVIVGEEPISVGSSEYRVVGYNGLTGRRFWYSENGVRS